MRTAPYGLTEAQLRAVLVENWGLTEPTLTYAPVGFGGHHWIAGGADGPAHFVTAQYDRSSLETSLAVAADLRDGQGLAFVVAPVRGVDGRLTAPCGSGYLVHVAPYLAVARDWPTAAEATPEQRRAAVGLTAALHGAVVPATPPPEDDFAIEARETLDGALDDLDTSWEGGIYAEGVRGRLRKAAPRLTAALAAYDRLAERVRARSATTVITHGEIKPGNLLVTPDGPALVDWDTVLLAPPERDLWRTTEADDLAGYTALTGHTVDPDALELYRTRWDLTDIALYVEDLGGAPERTDDTDLAWRELRRLLSS